MNLQGIALSWFRKDDWPRWCAMDPDFQPDYEHWLRRSEATLLAYQGAGIPMKKMLIDPDEFLEWSKANNAGVGTAARARFATLKLISSEAR